MYLHTFGKVELESSDLKGDKRLLFLTYLALQENAQFPQNLAELFWESEKTRLDNCYQLIRLLEKEGVLLRKDSRVYAVVASDVKEFKTCLQAEQIEKALQLYQGDFFEGINISKLKLGRTIELEGWLESTRANLASQLCQALMTTTANSILQGNGKEVVNYAEKTWQLTQKHNLALDENLDKLIIIAALLKLCESPFFSEICKEIKEYEGLSYPKTKVEALMILQKEYAAPITSIESVNIESASIESASIESVNVKPSSTTTLFTEKKVTSITPRDRHELLILLEEVERFWIDNVLEKSLYNQLMIALGKTTKPDAVDHPWKKVVAINGTSEDLPLNKPILEVFNELDKTLLILGEPGSGKTTTMLDLAKNLITEAKQDPKATIPVIFNLSSWATQRKALAEWLIDELASKYSVGKRRNLGRLWLESQKLLILLDGLDEVKEEFQTSCIRAINTFIVEYGVKELVVCSRKAEYEKLPVKLQFKGAILLKSLDNKQLDNYFEQVGKSLDALHTVLQEDSRVTGNHCWFPVP